MVLIYYLIKKINYTLPSCNLLYLPLLSYIVSYLIQFFNKIQFCKSESPHSQIPFWSSRQQLFKEHTFPQCPQISLEKQQQYQNNLHYSGHNEQKISKEKRREKEKLFIHLLCNFMAKTKCKQFADFGAKDMQPRGGCRTARRRPQKPTSQSTETGQSKVQLTIKMCVRVCVLVIQEFKFFWVVLE